VCGCLDPGDVRVSEFRCAGVWVRVMCGCLSLGVRVFGSG
jgi:hypothetical protein